MNMHRLAAAAGFAVLLAGVSSAQYSSSPIASNYIDISTTGTPLGLAGVGNGGATVPIGFAFTFYDSSLTSISACVNGYLTTGADLTDFSPDCPAPDTTPPNGLIAPFFDDFSCLAQGEVYYQTIGPALNRRTVIQWEDVGAFGNSTASLTFQTHLLESSNDIQFHYSTLADLSGVFPIDGAGAFVGVEDDAGARATVIGCEIPGILASNASYEIFLQVPYIMAPAAAAPGTTFTVPGVAQPFDFYVYAWSLSAGPIGPIPLLGFQSLDLGLDFKIAGSGIAGTSGDTISDVMSVPAGFGGTVVNWQMVTIGGFSPISSVSVSNPDTVILF